MNGSKISYVDLQILSEKKKLLSNKQLLSALRQMLSTIEETMALKLLIINLSQEIYAENLELRGQMALGTSRSLSAEKTRYAGTELYIW